MTPLTQPTKSARISIARVGFLSLLGAFFLVSCAGENLANLEEASTEQSQELASQVAESPPVPESPTAAAEPTATTPKLIKKAAITLVVESSEDSIDVVSELIETQQGYVIDFQDDKSQSSRGRQIVSMQIRVPQNKLDETLERLTTFGTVKSQSLTAEDVSEQLVDVQARLRNLRKQEELITQIMERSGSVGEVLQVAQELSNIRESIERIDAQFKNLQTQINYSTIYLKLEAPIASAPELDRPLGLQVRETWESSSRAAVNLTFGLLKLGIWLLSFSPYFVLLAVGLYGYKRFQNRRGEASDR